MTNLSVAIMQPYFLPYAGYFRLFAAADLFVIYDCVQFPRRGWVHRNRFVDSTGNERWLTLSLAKGARDILIRDLRFRQTAAEELRNELRRFPIFTAPPADAAALVAAIRDVGGTPLAYIERLLEQVVAYLGLGWNVLRSSSLDVPQSFRGQDRIIEIARRVGASRYVNSPGGRALYDQQAFAAANLELRFLSEYSGSKASIMTRILGEDRTRLASDIIAAARDVTA